MSTKNSFLSSKNNMKEASHKTFLFDVNGELEKINNHLNNGSLVIVEGLGNEKDLSSLIKLYELREKMTTSGINVRESYTDLDKNYVATLLLKKN